MLVLGIDTSTAVTPVGLVDDGAVRDDRFRVRRGHVPQPRGQRRIESGEKLQVVGGRRGGVVAPGIAAHVRARCRALPTVGRRGRIVGE
ncbi:MAG: hypothetical protein VW082_04335, partial [Candidatus Nanopelagicales bacterium]